MTTTTTTILPQVNENYTAINPEVEVDKFTEEWIERYFVDGQPEGGCRRADGLYQYCPLDGRTLVKVIPNGEFEVKTFVRVREYKTTLWEVVKR